MAKTVKLSSVAGTLQARVKAGSKKGDRLKKELAKAEKRLGRDAKLGGLRKAVDAVLIAL